MSKMDHLAHAIQQLATNKNTSTMAAHVRDIVGGVQELVETIRELQKKVAALETKGKV